MSNESRNVEIIRRRHAGEFPTDIAKAMGLTRNAVIGVCNRAGVVKRDAVASCRAHPPYPSCGSRHPGAKLSEGAVAKIRRLASSVSQADLAERFGVSTALISRVLRREAWKHVA